VSTTHESLQSLPEDTEGLRALVLTLMTKLDEVSSERDSLLQQNDRIRHLLLKLKRMQFGAKSDSCACFAGRL
jgi:nucleoid-associated protein YejK